MTVADDIIERLQTKIAYLERANNDLSDVVFRQQQEIRALSLKIEAIVERMVSSQTDEPVRSIDDERPPHY